ncbi:dTDP-4-dehydrorhamnose 3,5-epimerase [Streptomyces misionensis JCM 4497]
MVPGRRLPRGDRPRPQPRPGQLLGLQAGHPARHPLRRRPAEPGQVRQVRAGRDRRRRRRHPRRLTDVQAVGGGAARRPGPPRPLPVRGPRPRLLRPDGRRDGGVPLLRGLRPRTRARHPPVGPRPRHRVACRHRTPAVPQGQAGADTRRRGGPGPAPGVRGLRRLPQDAPRRLTAVQIRDGPFRGNTEGPASLSL